MRFPAMNERYKFWQGWTLALKIMNILTLYILKFQVVFENQVKMPYVYIYTPPPKKN